MTTNSPVAVGSFALTPQQPAPVLISSGGQSALGQPSATNLKPNSSELGVLFLQALQTPAEKCVLMQKPADNGV